MTYAIFLSALGVLTMAMGYLLYGSYIAQRHITTNVVTWAMWAVETVVVVAFIAGLTEDTAKTATFAVCALGGICILLLSVGMREYHQMEWWDLPVVLFEVAALVIFILYPDGVWGIERKAWLQIMNVVLALTALWTFVPILRTTWKSPETEIHWPWYVWAASYAFAAGVVAVGWKDEPYYWIELLYPVVCCPFHLAVGVISHARRRLPAPSLSTGLRPYGRLVQWSVVEPSLWASRLASRATAALTSILP